MSAARRKAVDILTRQIKGAEKIMGSDRATAVVENGKQNATTKVLDAKEASKRLLARNQEKD